MSPSDMTEVAHRGFHARRSVPHDLCTTCNEAKLCLGRTNLIRPVLFCENFDCYMPVETATAGAIAPGRTEYVAPHFADSKADDGICTNCEERGLCAPSRRGDTVWFCEEYV